MSSAWVRRSLEEISDFASEEVLAAFQQAAQDSESWERARLNPPEFFRSKDLAIPETIDATFDEEPGGSEVAPSGRRCLKICRREPLTDSGSPPILWCYEICLLGA